MSTVKANSYYDASGGSSAQLYGVSMRNGGTGWVNRIINGDMRIDQRNAGASVTPGDGAYTLDRWKTSVTQSSRISMQRVSTAPAGFTNSMLVTSLGATTVGASDTFGFYQPIEGFNVADLGFGTAGAATITVSFWVRSSITGTYSVAVTNGAVNRCYPVTYTINAANTWEQKTITVPGDTTGTWATDNGSGLQLFWNLGIGSLYGGATSGVWVGSLKIAASGQTNWVATNGATFYITGVQLEAGSVATPFERRPYGTELALCQRYYESLSVYGWGYAPSAGNIRAGVGFYKVSKRATPTVAFSNPVYANSSGVTAESISTSTFGFYVAASGAGVTYNFNGDALVSSEL